MNGSEDGFLCMGVSSWRVISDLVVKVLSEEFGLLIPAEVFVLRFPAGLVFQRCWWHPLAWFSVQPLRPQFQDSGAASVATGVGVWGPLDVVQAVCLLL